MSISPLIAQLASTKNSIDSRRSASITAIRRQAAVVSTLVQTTNSSTLSTAAAQAHAARQEARAEMRSLAVNNRGKKDAFKTLKALLLT